MVDCGQWAHTRSTNKQGAERVNGSQDRQGLANKASPLKPTNSGWGFVDPLPLMSHSTLWAKYPGNRRIAHPSLELTWHYLHFKLKWGNTRLYRKAQSLFSTVTIICNHHYFLYPELYNKLISFKNIFHIYLVRVGSLSWHSCGGQRSTQRVISLLKSCVIWELNTGGQVWKQLPFTHWVILPAWQINFPQAL